MEEHTIREIYSVTPLGEMVAVDFLRQTDTGRYRVLKYFYRDEWDEDISKNLAYNPCRAFDSENTVSKEIRLC